MAINANPSMIREMPATLAALPCIAAGPKKNCPNSGPASGAKWAVVIAWPPCQNRKIENGATTRNNSSVCSHVGSESSDGKSECRILMANVVFTGAGYEASVNGAPYHRVRLKTLFGG